MIENVRLARAFFYGNAHDFHRIRQTKKHKAIRFPPALGDWQLHLTMHCKDMHASCL